MEKEIEKKRTARATSAVWGGERRRSVELVVEMRRIAAGRIAGTEAKPERFFTEVIAAYDECFWIEGCDPPRVRDKLVSCKLKNGANPVARQPIPVSIPVSPFDDL